MVNTLIKKVGIITGIFAFSAGIAQETVKVPVTTAVPFLRITPDARAGGMGDVGIAVSADANATFHNPAKLAFVEKPLGFAVNYVPWLRALVNDVHLGYLSGYYKIDDVQTVAASFRYFSLGNIQFTDINGQELNQDRPYELAFDVNYARTLAELKKGGKVSIGAAVRFIYSDLASGTQVNTTTVKPGIAGAGDIGFAYNQDFKIAKKYKTNLAIGINLSNIGSKISYTNSAKKDFIPMNMGIGTRYQFNFDDYNQINLAVDVNKLLVPTPTAANYRDKSVPAALFSSFGDAPGGAKEEFLETTWSFGAEYWYNQIFAVRAGYFWEHEDKGARQFFTAGLGLRYSVFGLDFSYLIPTSTNRNPLDNTLRFTLLFEFDNVGRKQEATEATPTSRL